MSPADFVTDGAFYRALQGYYTDRVTVPARAYAPGSVDHIVSLLKDAKRHDNHNTGQNRR